jgi:hypothetical protein
VAEYQSTESYRRRFWSPVALNGWLEVRGLDVLSTNVLLAFGALAAVLGAAIWLPLVPSLAVCMAVGLVFTVWFWCGPVISTQTPTLGHLGFVLFAWAAGLWWWTVFVDTLSRHDVVRFNGDAGVGVIAEFFLWHLIDLVPLVDVDEALKWRMPLEYDNADIGTCVLLYQVFVVIPVIAIVRRAWTQRARR